MELKKNIIVLLILIMILIPSNKIFASEEQVQAVLDNYSFENNSEENENKENGLYSEAAILMESQTGKILFEKNIHDRKYPASTTKVLTAIIAIEKCDLSETATASLEAISSLKDGYTKADIQVRRNIYNKRTIRCNDFTIS